MSNRLTNLTKLGTPVLVTSVAVLLATIVFIVITVGLTTTTAFMLMQFSVFGWWFAPLAVSAILSLIITICLGWFFWSLLRAPSEDIPDEIVAQMLAEFDREQQQKNGTASDSDL